MSSEIDAAGRGSFWLRKLHSLSGVLPIGVWFVWQLWLHGKALLGPEALAEAVRPSLLSMRAAWLALVLVPLGYHVLYGLGLVLSSEYNLGRYPTSRNWMYVLQRVTGVIALLFLGYHAYAFWLPLERGALAPAQLHAALVASLSATTWGVPWLALGYMVGLAAAAFHLAGGAARFCLDWGLAGEGSGARAGVATLAAILGLATFGLGAGTVLHLATGWQVVGARHGDPAVLCPAPSVTPSAAASTRREP